MKESKKDFIDEHFPNGASSVYLQEEGFEILVDKGSFQNLVNWMNKYKDLENYAKEQGEE